MWNHDAKASSTIFLSKIEATLLPLETPKLSIYVQCKGGGSFTHNIFYRIVKVEYQPWGVRVDCYFFLPTNLPNC
jgi:hypothetical protein